MSARIIFITGTDTGIGKTVFTGLFLSHLRLSGVRAFAVKPFCSGGREDAEIVHVLSDGEWTLDEINPYSFPEPVTPLVAARKHGVKIRLSQVVSFIKRAAKRCDYLLVEGAGGLLAPLGEGFTARELIAKLKCEVIIVSANRLGTINHTLLTVEALRRAGSRKLTVVLMDAKKKDLSAKSNDAMLVEKLASTPLLRLPRFAGDCGNPVTLKKHARSSRKVLDALL